MCLFCPLQTLNGGTNVIQLETAAGAAIRNFHGAVGKLCQVVVDREMGGEEKATCRVERVDGLREK